MVALFERFASKHSQLAHPLTRAATRHHPSHSQNVKHDLQGAPDVSRYVSISMPELISEVGVLSPGSVLVGACEDSLHFYLDLGDPRPGSVLIAGDQQAGQARLLHTILSSAVLLNAYRGLRFVWISDHPAPDEPLLRQPHCFSQVAPGSRSAGQVITKLADLAEKRMSTGNAESWLLLAIDDVDELCDSLNDQEYADLTWLIRNGPALRIWSFATLDASHLDGAGRELIDLFGTCLLGHMNAAQATLFQGDPSVTSGLVAGKQFCVWFDDQWLTFWVPEPAVSYQPGTKS